MNRFPLRFIVFLAAILFADVVLAAAVALLRGSGFVGVARIAIGLSGVALLTFAPAGSCVPSPSVVMALWARRFPAMMSEWVFCLTPGAA